jgi:hypothetical protein
MHYAAPQNIKSRNDDYAIIIGGFTLDNVSYIHGRSTRRHIFLEVDLWYRS